MLSSIGALRSVNTVAPQGTRRDLDIAAIIDYPTLAQPLELFLAGGVFCALENSTRFCNGFVFVTVLVSIALVRHEIPQGFEFSKGG
jgi:hypothetical protein